MHEVSRATKPSSRSGLMEQTHQVLDRYTGRSQASCQTQRDPGVSQDALTMSQHKAFLNAQALVEGVPAHQVEKP